MAHFQRITPCLWFDNQAEEAANFYVSIFKNSRVIQTARYGEAGHEIHGQPAGSVLTVLFALDGQEFTALNGGPQFTFSEAISLQIACETQAEIDYYWGRLTESGKEGPCGWLTDKFGLSWQVTPAAMGEIMSGPNADKAMNAMFSMSKLDIAALKRAAAGE
ncbi:MAG TPA: VOC family protein [Symbiobacteriaceae bacterium]|nr:VOC family protein [Symbiobacteriaceae bacterium]